MEFSSNNHSNGNNKPNTIQDLVAANVHFLIEQLEGGRSEVLTQYLSAMARFHTYSFGNILLIARQKPTATHVAGMRAWNELDRRVKRGEKGIRIFAPVIGYKRIQAVAETEAKGKKTKKNAPTEAKTEALERELIGFRAVHVFDVTQTEGDPLPEMGSTVKGEVGETLPRLIEFVEFQQIKLEFSNKIVPARGMSYGGFIRLLPNMSPTETLSTLVHELAHEMLHKAERRTLITKTVKETEAEAIAFVVCHALGLEIGTGSADYIQLYHGDSKLLQESLEVVQRAASQILGAISPRDEGSLQYRVPLSRTRMPSPSKRCSNEDHWSNSGTCRTA